MARRLVLWWKERTLNATMAEPVWVSFAHLYIDYQLAWGCAGPIKSGQGWLDVATRPYIEPERHNFLQRVKWFRRCLKYFWQHTEQKIGLAQCRPVGTSILSYVTCASLQWDEICLTKADQWIMERCREPCHRGSSALKGLPLATRAEGMAISEDPQSGVVRSN